MKNYEKNEKNKHCRDQELGMEFSRFQELYEFDCFKKREQTHMGRMVSYGYCHPINFIYKNQTITTAILFKNRLQLTFPQC